jgi:hypothetical protein
MFQSISEEAYTSNTPVKILEESMVPGSTDSRLIFRAVLQEANVINNNKRMYPSETLQAIVYQLRDKARTRKLLGELDHPQPQGDMAAKMKRSSTILLQNVCVLFRKLDFIDGKIYAEVETLNTPSGRIVRDLLKDNISIGFSLRAFGSTKNENGTTVVLADDIKGLTFDVVANPSHDNALIQEFLAEGEEASAKDKLKELLQEMTEYKKALQGEVHPQLMEESRGLFESIREDGKAAMEGMTGQVCINGICMAKPLNESIDYLVEQSLKMDTAKYQKNIRLK